MSSPASDLSLLIRAGAGAGKTTALTQSVVEFFKDFHAVNHRHPKVVVCTFTRKATQELKERLVHAALESNDLALLQFVTSPHLLHISTIHGVISLFLKDVALQWGLDPSFGVLTEADAEVEAKKLLFTIFKKHSHLAEVKPLLRWDEWAEQCRSFFNHWCLHPELRPWNDQDLMQHMRSQLKLAADDLTEMLDGCRRLNAPEKYLKDLEGLFEQLLSVQHRLQNQVQDFQGGLALLSGWLKSWPSKPTKPKGIDEGLESYFKTSREKIKKRIAQLAEVDGIELWLKNIKAFHAVALEFSQLWLDWKLKNSKLEMQDLENLAARWLKQKPEQAVAFSQRWDFWLIDEFQDTSPNQVAILDQLRQDTPCFLVGDPQQSIYLFRGARSEVFLQKMAAFVAEEKQTRMLQTNYRSRPELLCFFNDFFTQLSPQFAPMVPKSSPEDPSQVVAEFFIVPEPKASGEESTKVSAELSSDPPHDETLESIEAQCVAEKISEKLSQGVKPQQICVLCRKGKHIELMARALKTKGVPIQQNLSRGFFNRREILDAMALCQVLLKPMDEEALLTLLRSPYFFIPDTNLANALEQKTTAQVAITLYQSEDSLIKKQIARLRIWQEQMTTHAISEVMQAALSDLGFFAVSYHLDGSGRRESNLWKWLHELRQAETQPGFNIHAWLHALEAARDAGEDSDAEATAVFEPNRVVVMSVHAAKGLQFDHVFVPFCGETLQGGRSQEFYFYPDSERYGLALRLNSSSPESFGEELLVKTPMDRGCDLDHRLREQEESLRLLYVAATRAKTSLVLSWRENFKTNSWAAQFITYLNTQGGEKLGQQQRTHYAFTFEKLKRSSPLEVSVETLLAGKDFLEPRAPWMEKTTNPVVSQSVTAMISWGYENKKSGAASVATLWAKNRGVEFHRAMESLARLCRSVDFSASVFEAYVNGFPPEWSQALRYVFSITEPSFAELLATGNAEWGFTVRNSQTKLRGQIDLWGYSQGKLWVVDYKSGSSVKLEQTFEQLSVYAKVLRQFGHQQQAHLAAVFPMQNRLEIRVL